MFNLLEFVNYLTLSVYVCTRVLCIQFGINVRIYISGRRRVQTPTHYRRTSEAKTNCRRDVKVVDQIVFVWTSSFYVAFL